MPEPRQFGSAIGTKVAGDRAVAALADEQHGVVSRAQLLDAGLSASAIKRWVGAGRLIALHRGVYAVGHARLTRDGHRVAALRAAGTRAALSHREAAAVHALLPSAGARVELTIPGRRNVSGVSVHRAGLDSADVTQVDGLPVTTVARTLVDLAGVLPRDRLRKALDEAERSHRLDVGAIEAVLRRTRGRNGCSHAAVRAALAELASTTATVTRSPLEDRFLALVAEHGLPRPLMNANIDGIEVDAVWRPQRLVVELDGWEFHRTRQAFQRDRDRDNVLTAKGWTVLRFTHADVMRRPATTVQRIRQAATGTG